MTESITPKTKKDGSSLRSKSEYFKHDFDLSQNQINKIVKSIKNKEPIILRFTKESFHNGNISLPLTKKESMNVVNNKGFDYTLNKTKLNLLKVKEKNGGIIPFLIPLLAGITALGSVIGASTGIAKTVLDKKSNDANLEEEKRKNNELIKAAKGDAIFLNPWKNGMSLDVKEFINGSGLDDIGKKSLRNIIKNISTNFKIERQGNSIYLSPFPQ